MPPKVINGGGFLIPTRTNPSVTVSTFDITNNTGDAVGFVQRLDRSGTIEGGVVYWGSHLDAQDCTIGLETVSTTTGFPTGTDYGGSTRVTVTPTSSVWENFTLAGNATATRGDIVALVIRGSGAASMNVRATVQGASTCFAMLYPYTVYNTGASWSKRAEDPFCALRYNDGVYSRNMCEGFLPDSSDVRTVGGDGIDEVGNQYTLLFPTRTKGFWIQMNRPPGITFEVNLYQGTTVLEQVIVDTDMMSSGASRSYLYGHWTTERTLEISPTTYVLSLRALTASQHLIDEQTFETLALHESYDFGSQIAKAERLGGGAWTITNTRRMRMGLVCDRLNG